jgi:hypothetical protein
MLCDPLAVIPRRIAKQSPVRRRPATISPALALGISAVFPPGLAPDMPTHEMAAANGGFLLFSQTSN